MNYPSKLSMQNLVLLFTLSIGLLATSTAFAAPPTFSKAFAPAEIGPGSHSTLTFTITNIEPAPVVDLAFTDNLPAGMTIANPAQMSTNCLENGASTFNATVGGTVVSFSGYDLGAGQSCNVKVNVTSVTPGVATNISGDLTSSLGNSGTAQADLTVFDNRPGFTKQFSPNPLALGGRGTLTYTFDNSLNSSNVVYLDFTDQLPSSIKIANPANITSDCGTTSFNLTAAPDSSEISLTASGIVVPANSLCTLAVDVVTTGAGDLESTSSNLVVITSSSFTQLSAGKAGASLTSFVTPVAIQKEFLEDPVAPGTTVSLKFTLSNFSRDFSATGVSFTDNLNDTLTGLNLDSVTSNDCGGTVTGTSLLSLAGGTIAAQSSCSISVVLNVPPSAIPGSYPNTTSAVQANVDGSPIIGNMATDTLFVSPAPTLTVAYTDDPVNAGDPVTVEYVITNTSATSGATGVSFNHPFPTIIPTASATPATECCGTGSNCYFTPLITSNPGSPATFVVEGGTLASAGSSGDACAISLTLDVSPTAAAGNYINSTSSVTAVVDGAERTGEPGSDTLVVVAAPALVKSFTPDSIVPGGTTTLEFTLTHNADANTAATNITFTDDLGSMLAGTTASLPALPDPPCGAGSTLVGSSGDSVLTLSGASLEPDESCTFSVDISVPAGHVGTYTNTTSEVTATVDGLSTRSIPATADLMIPGLAVNKSFEDYPVIPGDTVTLRYTIENNDPDHDATNIVFTENYADILPGSPDITILSTPGGTTCGGTVSEISSTFLFFSGGSATVGAPPCTFDVVLTVPGAANDGDYTSTSSNPNATVNGGTVSVSPAIDVLEINESLLALSKEFTNDPVAPGGTVELKFTLTNLAASNAISDIEFSDDLGATLSNLVAAGLVTSNCTGLTISGAMTDYVTFSDISLPANDNCSFSINLSVPGSASEGIYLNTTSEVTGKIGGLDVTGNAATDQLYVQSLMSFTKSFDGPTTAGSTSLLTFTITNSTAQVQSNFSFSDNLDAMLSGAVATSLPATPCGASSAITGTSFLTFTGGELAASGGTCTFAVPVQIPISATAGTYVNSTSNITVSGLPVSAPATANLQIVPAPLFSKRFLPDTLDTSGTEASTLMFTIDNSASSLAASNVSFVDTLPTGITVASPANASSTCTGGTLTAAPGQGSITYSGGTVGAGATCTLLADTIGTTPGTYINTTGDLTSSNGNSGTATDTLTIVLLDSDSDTIADHIDNCPTIPNTDQADLDQDSIGNVCDDDIDGDQMPNYWEIEHGLNPYNSFDQLADLDGDGFTNLQEYLFRTDPNSFDADENENGIPDVVEARVPSVVPNILFPLIIED